MTGYSTATAVNDSTPAMGAGTSLFRRLSSVPVGYTVTGWDLGIYYSGQSTGAAAGIPSATTEAPSELEFGLSSGASGFTPSNLVGGEDAAELEWFIRADDGGFSVVVPASTTWQWIPTFHWRIRHRFQYRLAAAQDWCFQVGNQAATTQTFQFQVTLRVYYT